MITCQVDACEWRGFTSELSEHEWVDHGIGTWGDRPDCPDCGGNGEVVSRFATPAGDERWDLCRTCKGQGWV